MAFSFLCLKFYREIGVKPRPPVKSTINRPLAPNSEGTRKIKFFQSPPVLVDLGA
jgi:hypothetical protein